MKISVAVSRRFSLVELMVGMTILSIMMLMMFRFVVASQKTLDWSDKVWRLYENSRVVFDLVERDFQSSVTSSIPNQQIAFYIGDPDAVSDPSDTLFGLYLCFVASLEPDDDATSRLMEVSYKFHTDTDETKPFTLVRKLVDDTDTDWNFFGNPPDWYINSTDGYETVVAGMDSLSMKFYSAESAGVELIKGQVLSEKPTRIEITISLFDESLINVPETVRNELKVQTARQFTKIIYYPQTED